MYAIYANIGGILMVNVAIYSSTMDPMGNNVLMKSPVIIVKILCSWILPLMGELTPSTNHFLSLL